MLRAVSAVKYLEKMTPSAEGQTEQGCVCREHVLLRAMSAEEHLVPTAVYEERHQVPRAVSAEGHIGPRAVSSE